VISTTTNRTLHAVGGATVIAMSLIAWPSPRPLAAQESRGSPETYAQRLVDRMVAVHADLDNVELAILSDASCATLAATERASDVGEKCDDDEYGPIRTGHPNVEKPTKEDPIYDITQALHDASGHLIGAVGMDIAPPSSGGGPAAVARARVLLRELEAQIPSRQRLYDMVSIGITKDAAAAVALSKVPGGTIQSGEFEREMGHWVYSFDLNVPGESGVREVLVDADDGQVVSLQHESAGAEAREAAQDTERSEAAEGDAKGEAREGAEAGYHVARTFTLGGRGGWDYLSLDTATDRLFIGRSDRVMVVDPANGRVLGEVSGLDRAHGVAFDYAAGRGFATSGADSTVVIFDLKTLQVLGRTAVDVDDDAILFDPVTRHIFTFDGDAHTASVVDPVSGSRLATIDLGAKPEFGVSDGQGHVYVNLESTSQIAEIDPVAMKVVREWPLAPCESPSGLAIDPVHHILFSGCHNQVMVMSDAVAGKVVASAPIGRGVDACRYDAGIGLAFASTGDGAITVIREDGPTKFHVVRTVKTQEGARTMELDPKTHHLYTVTARFAPAPPAGPGQRRRRPPMVPGSFTLLVLER